MILYNKQVKCYNIAGVVFLPGMNEIEDIVFNSLKEVEMFSSLLKNNSFKVVKDIEKTKDEIVKEINPAMSSQKKEEAKKDLGIKKVLGSLNKQSIGKKKKEKEDK